MAFLGVLIDTWKVMWWRARTMLVVIVGACGRIGFDPSGYGDGGLTVQRRRRR